MDAVNFQYTKPLNFTLGVKKAPNTDAQQDSALALFKNLAQQADLPSLPSLPSLKPDIPSTSTKPDEGEEVPAPATVTVSSITTTSESEEQAPAPQEEEYIPVEATVLPPAAPTSTKPAAVYAPSNTSSAADIEANIGRRPYWMQHCQQIRSPLLRLHQEMVELTELLQPSPDETQSRQEAVEEVADIVKSLWPTSQVTVFGSFATGLYVPTSDIDLVITESKAPNIQLALKSLATALERTGVAHKMQVISKARVPIIKFETVKHGGLAFDVSFDVANGPQAAELVREFTGDWPMMRPLVLVLKLFLQQRELNEVYTGGIGSYALITMIGAFLQLHNSRVPRQPANTKKGGKQQPQQTALLEPCLGVLIVDFFRLFGRVLNMRDVGMASSGGGHFYRKDSRPDGADWTNPERPYVLSVEDPKDATNDICRSSYNIMRVKSAFEFAYQQLTAPSSPHESLLARVLRLGAILVSRKRPTNLRALYSSMPGGKAQEDDKQQQQQQQQQQQKPQQPRGHKRERVDEKSEAGPSRKEMRTGGGGGGGVRSSSAGRDDSTLSLQGGEGSSSDGEEDEVEEGEEPAARLQAKAAKKAARSKQQNDSKRMKHRKGGRMGESGWGGGRRGGSRGGGGGGRHYQHQHQRRQHPGLAVQAKPMKHTKQKAWY